MGPVGKITLMSFTSISFTPAPVSASITPSPYNSPLQLRNIPFLPRRAIDRNFIS